MSKFIGNSVNISATIAEVAGVAFPDGAGLAVKYDAAGKVIPTSTLGEAAVGILPLRISCILFTCIGCEHDRDRGLNVQFYIKD